MVRILSTREEIARDDVEQFEKALRLLDPGLQGDADRQAWGLIVDLATVEWPAYPKRSSTELGPKRLRHCAAVLLEIASLLEGSVSNPELEGA
jgi:hypothetical protein